MFESCGLAAKVDCRLGDGLKVTEKGELNGAICCGMGGFLMRDIVDAGPEPLEFYVLQPQNGQKELRQYMVQKRYVIVLEIIVEDAGKLYTAFLAVRNDCVEAYTGMTEYVDVYQNVTGRFLVVVCRGFIGTRQTTTLDKIYRVFNISTTMCLGGYDREIKSY